MAQQLIDLALLLLLTTALVMILRLLKQPAIIAYILAGVIIGPSVLNISFGNELLEVFSTIGVAFLLFIVGISLDWRGLRRVGWVATATGLGQVVTVSTIGFLLGLFFGLTPTESIFVGLALSFSSTIIVIKFLTDNQDLDSLYGRISIGFMLVQDLIAIIVLMVIGTFAETHTSALATILLALTKVAFAIGLSWAITKYVLPLLLKFAGKSQEVLFLFSVTWCFAFAAFFSAVGFGIEIGALAAGLMLAGTQYNYEIASRIKPLRDFFIILFFILLGSQIDLTAMTTQLLPSIVFSAFILLGTPPLILFLMGLLGYSKRTAFMAGITVSQISEFSLILIAIGYGLGHVSGTTVSTITLVALLTIIGSTYYVRFAKGFYHRFKTIIPYKRRGIHHQEDRRDHHLEAYDAILFGHNRIGYSILNHFAENDKHFLVVDFNPEIVFELQQQGVPAIFGDAEDSELFEELHLERAEVVVSTVPDYHTNKLVLLRTREKAKKAVIILTATQVEDALKLYEEGADYVIIPHIVGGDHAAIILDTLDKDLDEFIKHKTQHVEQLKKRHHHNKKHSHAGK